MRWLIIVLALCGIVAASLALREHYRTGASPCKINDKWDCGEVNHSEYAVLAGVPVAVIGIAGYFLLAILAWRKAWRIVTAGALVGLAFSLYLTHIEASILQVWCIYCVISLATISSISLAALLWAVIELRQARKGLAAKSG
jgi:uncharacterized membrane protein